jgi:hypothetical protein
MNGQLNMGAQAPTTTKLYARQNEKPSITKMNYRDLHHRIQNQNFSDASETLLEFGSNIDDITQRKDLLSLIEEKNQKDREKIEQENRKVGDDFLDSTFKLLLRIPLNQEVYKDNYTKTIYDDVYKKIKNDISDASTDAEKEKLFNIWRIFDSTISKVNKFTHLQSEKKHKAYDKFLEELESDECENKIFDLSSRFAVLIGEDSYMEMYKNLLNKVSSDIKDSKNPLNVGAAYKKACNDLIEKLKEGMNNGEHGKDGSDSYGSYYCHLDNLKHILDFYNTKLNDEKSHQLMPLNFYRKILVETKQALETLKEQEDDHQNYSKEIGALERSLLRISVELFAKLAFRIQGKENKIDTTRSFTLETRDEIEKVYHSIDIDLELDSSVREGMKDLYDRVNELYEIHLKGQEANRPSRFLEGKETSIFFAAQSRILSSNKAKLIQSLHKPIEKLIPYATVSFKLTRPEEKIGIALQDMIKRYGPYKELIHDVGTIGHNSQYAAEAIKVINENFHKLSPALKVAAKEAYNEIIKNVASSLLSAIEIQAKNSGIDIGFLNSTIGKLLNHIGESDINPNYLNILASNIHTAYLGQLNIRSEGEPSNNLVSLTENRLTNYNKTLEGLLIDLTKFSRELKALDVSKDDIKASYEIPSYRLKVHDLVLNPKEVYNKNVVDYCEHRFYAGKDVIEKYEYSLEGIRSKNTIDNIKTELGEKVEEKYFHKLDDETVNAINKRLLNEYIRNRKEEWRNGTRAMPKGLSQYLADEEKVNKYVRQYISDRDFSGKVRVYDQLKADNSIGTGITSAKKKEIRELEMEALSSLEAEEPGLINRYAEAHIRIFNFPKPEIKIVEKSPKTEEGENNAKENEDDKVLSRQRRGRGGPVTKIRDGIRNGINKIKTKKPNTKNPDTDVDDSTTTNNPRVRVVNDKYGVDDANIETTTLPPNFGENPSARRQNNDSEPSSDRRYQIPDPNANAKDNKDKSKSNYRTIAHSGTTKYNAKIKNNGTVAVHMEFDPTENTVVTDKRSGCCQGLSKTLDNYPKTFMIGTQVVMFGLTLGISACFTYAQTQKAAKELLESQIRLHGNIKTVEKNIKTPIEILVFLDEKYRNAYTKYKELETYVKRKTDDIYISELKLYISDVISALDTIQDNPNKQKIIANITKLQRIKNDIGLFNNKAEAPHLNKEAIIKSVKDLFLESYKNIESCAGLKKQNYGLNYKMAKLFTLLNKKVSAYSTSNVYGGGITQHKFVSDLYLAYDLGAQLISRSIAEINKSYSRTKSDIKKLTKNMNQVVKYISDTEATHSKEISKIDTQGFERKDIQLIKTKMKEIVEDIKERYKIELSGRSQEPDISEFPGEEIENTSVISDVFKYGDKDKKPNKDKEQDPDEVSLPEGTFGAEI